MTRIALLTILLAGTAAPAFAQTDPMAMAHQSSANLLGVMEYCKGQGYVGDDAVTAQRDSVSRLPASAVSTADAEAKGKAGSLVSPNGTAMTLASIASQQGGTVESLCKKMGDSALQVTAMMKQNGMTGAPGTMPAMPSMSGMPSMPTMNGMPGMPGTSAIPAMPGMPAAPAK